MREKGLRITQPREAILECLLATDEHPSARMIWETVRKKIPLFNVFVEWKKKKKYIWRKKEQRLKGFHEWEEKTVDLDKNEFLTQNRSYSYYYNDKKAAYVYEVEYELRYEKKRKEFFDLLLKNEWRITNK